MTYRKVRTKSYNPECHVSVKVAEDSLFEATRDLLRKKARAFKKRTGQELSYQNTPFILLGRGNTLYGKDSTI